MYFFNNISNFYSYVKFYILYSVIRIGPTVELTVNRSQWRFGSFKISKYKSKSIQLLKIIRFLETGRFSGLREKKREKERERWVCHKCDKESEVIKVTRIVVTITTIMLVIVKQKKTITLRHSYVTRISFIKMVSQLWIWEMLGLEFPVAD